MYEFFICLHLQEIKEQSLESKMNIVEIERDSVQIDKDINDDGNESKTSDDSHFYNTMYFNQSYVYCNSFCFITIVSHSGR